jgi:hypothetical protein
VRKEGRKGGGRGGGRGRGKSGERGGCYKKRGIRERKKTFFKRKISTKVEEKNCRSIDTNGASRRAHRDVYVEVTGS